MSESNRPTNLPPIPVVPAETATAAPVVDAPEPEVEWSNSPATNFRKRQSQSLGQILVRQASLTEKQLDEALTLQKENTEGKKLGEILIERKFVTEEDMLRALAYQLDLPFYDRLPVNDIDPTLVIDISIQFCRDNHLLPIAKDDFNVTVAVADPLNVFALDDLRLILATNINMVVTPPEVIRNSINRVYERAQDASQKVIDELNEPSAEIDDLEETKDLLESSDDEKPIIRLVNQLLARAVKERASDIHIEPYEHEIAVRFRIDGNLQDKMQLPKRHMGTVATRIKILGKLNIAEKRIPQDGRISIKVAGKEIDVRLSTLPTSHGERIVMRLLDKSTGAKRLEDLGLNESFFQAYTDVIKKKHGIFLVTGPTGSGKTSLLYASMLHIARPDINILTIEDPVEYQLAGVGQTEVKDKVGMTFGAGLRAILRQDPDVIMIGEIRDAETAGIAVQSSMTGHLVLSTVHTNDTASTVTRMMDFGIEPFKLSSALLGVVATRLVRVLCTNCKIEHKPFPSELERIGLKQADIEGRKIYQSGPGCERCYGTGYKDRMGVYELLVLDDELKELIAKTQDSNVIKKRALKKGMLTLRDSAVERVLNGLTSIDEAVTRTQTDDAEIDQI